jgi:ectoine hydroxylase-related dioxygenase (phytanoyl-CoA dioxygenase family)
LKSAREPGGATASLEVALEAPGFAVVPGTLEAEEIDRLVAAAVRAAAPSRAGIRDLFAAAPEVCELAGAPAVRGAAASVLGPACFAVRAILFDKTPRANWKVPWHQDLTIAVRSRRDVPAYGPWSTKAGIAHVQPPVAVLERMVAVRVHLDRCGPDDGPLRVIPGSHRAGRLGPGEIEELRARVKEVVCEAERGGLLAIRPLLLHASSPARAPGHRRVIHIEYAAAELAGGLEWRERR